MSNKYTYFRKYFTFEGKQYSVRGKTEKEAILKMANKIRDLEEGKIATSSKMLVSDWTYQAIDAYKTNQSTITREKYVSRIRHCILKEIGDMPLSQVKPLHCQNVLNLQIGKSKTQINEVAQGLKFIFSSAVENQLILKSPADYIKKPAGYQNRRRAITAKERSHILKVLPKDSRFVIFALMLFCGCRPSESCKVKRSDFKKVKGTLVLHIRGTKTQKSDRVVPVPKVLEEMIKDFLNKENSFNFIACTNDGNAFNDRTLRRLWLRFKREMNLSMGCQVYRNKLQEPLPLAPDLVPYCLRHTYCTDLQKAGVDIRTAQYLMGHSTIQLTADIYTHADEEIVLEAARLIKNNI